MFLQSIFTKFIAKHAFKINLISLTIWFLLFNFLLLTLSGQYNLRILLHIIYSIALYKLIYILYTEKYFIIYFIIRFIVSIVLGLIGIISIYCLESGTYLSNTAIGAALQTDTFEAIDYVTDNFIHLQYIATFFVTSLVSWFTLRACNSFVFPRFLIKWKLISTIVCICCLLIFPFALEPIKRIIHVAKDYRRQLVILEENRKQLSASLNIAAEKRQKGELYVIVIGESASRDYMQAYGGPVQNTPWMAAMGKNAGFVLFTNAYATDITTVPALCAALEKGNWYTGLKFPNSPTLLTVSKAAGLKTIWISNQTRYAAFGTPISGIASFADEQVFPEKAVGPLSNVDVLDIRLLPYLDETLMRHDSSANMLIVVHIVGSHAPYYKRYSEQTRKMLAFDEKQSAIMEQTGDADRLKEYYASLLETDRLLQQIFERLDKLLGVPVVLVYMSDHGESPYTGGGHNQDRFTWSMARIPLTVWCSQDWRKRYPERFEVLKNNKDKIFTNDLLFDLYMGMADIHFEDKSEQFDLSSRNYGLTSDGAAIVQGRYHIRDDPGLRVK